MTTRKAKKPRKPKSKEAEFLDGAFKVEGALTQAQAAEKMELTPGAISQWTTGRRPVPLEHAQTLAALLNVPPEQISAAYRDAVAILGARINRRVAEDHSNYAGWSAYAAASPETRVAVDLLLRPKSERSRLDPIIQLAIGTLEKSGGQTNESKSPEAA